MQPTPQQARDFKRYYGTEADRALAKRFGVPLKTVATWAKKWCLRKDKRFLRDSGTSGTMPRWTAEDLAWLHENFADTSNLEIARKLRRSVKSIASKASRLGLLKSAERLTEMGRTNVRIRHYK